MAHPRFGLSITLPARPNIEKTCQDILAEREVVGFCFSEMTAEGTDLVVKAFTAVKPNKIKRFELISVFCDNYTDRYTDLVKIWDAVKHKIQALNLDQNTIPKKFKQHMLDDIKKDPSITLKDVSCQLCSEPEMYTPGMRFT